jgi:hypothetical protein
VAEPPRQGLRPSSRTERGQASLEVLAFVPLLVVVAVAGFQLLATGQAVTLADGAAEAGAMALATGEDPLVAARSALPGWAEKRAAVEVEEGRVTVTLRPPAPSGALARALEVDSSAWARRPEAGR